MNMTYTIKRRTGPSVSIENEAGSKVQTAKTRWTFAVECSFHGEHLVNVADPALQSVKAEVEAACAAGYKSAPEIGASWVAVL